ncbi:MAG: sulfatase-like hydrolase/transferase [Planctomycetota bacterium]
MPDRPHVLFVMTDHWPAALLGAAGHPVIQTPTLDQIARNGMCFTNCYAECPVCVPARRTIMTGTTPRFHGDRVYNELLPMPEVPTLAQCFRDGGYQAFAVGKLHTCPQRNRIGFDDVILMEEGRTQYGLTDDYEQDLSEHGFHGRFFETGMCNNEYMTRPWSLPEQFHPTHWATRKMCQTIRRRDPRKPMFLYLSYMHPHPPLWPLEVYHQLYRQFDPAALEQDRPVRGAWAERSADPPPPPRIAEAQRSWAAKLGHAEAARQARAAFYALCTHIDHQLRVVLGTLREAKMLDDTLILFTSDHGDMLGNHGLWGKSLFYEDSAGVPLLLSAGKAGTRVQVHAQDDRLCGHQDIMPTLLDLCGLPIPASVQGRSMLAAERRDTLFGEIAEGAHATRMIRRGDWKLIYYAGGNRTQLFNLKEDPRELLDRADVPACAAVRADLTARLIAELHGGDEAWVQNGHLVGLPAPAAADGAHPHPNFNFSNQRGLHYF